MIAVQPGDEVLVWATVLRVSDFGRGEPWLVVKPAEGSGADPVAVPLSAIIVPNPIPRLVGSYQAAMKAALG